MSLTKQPKQHFELTQKKQMALPRLYRGYGASGQKPLDFFHPMEIGCFAFFFFFVFQGLQVKNNYHLYHRMLLGTVKAFYVPLSMGLSRPGDPSQTQ